MKLVVFGLILSVSLAVLPTNSHAKEEINYQEIYDQGVSAGRIKADEVSLEQWIEASKTEYYPVYSDGLKEDVYDETTTYAEWIKMNNYGQPPAGNTYVEEVKPALVKGVYKGYNVRKGDILVTNGTSAPGVLGHTAIANGNEYILDIPRPGETTRQQPTSKWMTYYDNKGWVKVYRINDSSVANAAANWADRNYYSSSGSSVQNKWPKYGLTGSRYATNPTYCSKIVLQAYYFGSGSKPVIKVFPSIVSPYDLQSYFSSQYSPYQVKSFN